jgi:hypothetical protein
VRATAVQVHVRRLVVDRAHVAISAHLADAIGRALHTEMVGGGEPAPRIPRAIARRIAQQVGCAGMDSNLNATGGSNP